MTVEHVIPKSLIHVDIDELILRNKVCKKCNSNLGLFVDASVSRDYFLSSWFQSSAMACYDPLRPIALPVMCLGTMHVRLPAMEVGEICEVYLGPLAEKIVWVRGDEKSLYWYVGGNPRTTKDKPSRAYFFLSDRSLRALNITAQTFKNAFRRRCNIKKGPCAEIDRSQADKLGMKEPDQIDLDRIAALTHMSSHGLLPHLKRSRKLDFDSRFLAKIAIGIGYYLFGDKVLVGEYAETLRAALWESPSAPASGLRGQGLFMSTDFDECNIMGIPYAVTIAIIPIPEGITVSLYFGDKYQQSVLCTTSDMLSTFDQQMLDTGLVFVVYPYIGKIFRFSLFDYVGFRTGSCRHHEIEKIQAAIAQNKNYFRSL